MDEQIPPGPADKHCPLFRKRADKVCQSCMWWTRIQMDHPQNESEKINRWMCAQSAQVWTSMDNGRQQRATAISIQELSKTVGQGNAGSQVAIAGMTEMFNRVVPAVVHVLPPPQDNEPKRLA